MFLPTAQHPRHASQVPDHLLDATFNLLIRALFFMKLLIFSSDLLCAPRLSTISGPVRFDYSQHLQAWISVDHFLSPFVLRGAGLWPWVADFFNSDWTRLWVSITHHYRLRNGLFCLLGTKNRCFYQRMNPLFVFVLSALCYVGVLHPFDDESTVTSK